MNMLFKKKNKRDWSYRVRIIIRDWKNDFDKDNYLQYIPYVYKRGVLTLYTIKTGVVIGLHGKTIDDLRDRLYNEVEGFKEIKVKEIRDYVA